MMKTSTALCCLLLPLFVGLGCTDAPEGDNQVPLHPVTGVLTIGGSPKAGIGVSLVPDDPAQPSATGVTAEDGTYTLKTGHREGAVAGSHKVVLTFSPPPSEDAYKSGGKPPKPVEVPFPKEWSSAETSPKTVEVKAGDNTIPIEVP